MTKSEPYNYFHFLETTSQSYSKFKIHTIKRFFLLTVSAKYFQLPYRFFGTKEPDYKYTSNDSKKRPLSQLPGGLLKFPEFLTYAIYLQRNLS